MEALDKASKEIDSVARDYDVFIKVSDWGDIDIVDENDTTYATTNFDIDGHKLNPEDAIDLCDSAFGNLSLDFEESYDVTKAQKKLQKIIDTYA